MKFESKKWTREDWIMVAQRILGESTTFFELILINDVFE